MNWKFWQPQIVIKTVEVDRELTEMELIERLSDLLGDVNSVEVTKEGYDEIFTKMSNIDGVLDMLRDTMANDIKRAFSTPNGPEGDNERAIIRGGFSRTAYFRAQILDKVKK